MYIILYIKIIFNIGLNIKVLWYVGGLYIYYYVIMCDIELYIVNI